MLAQHMRHNGGGRPQVLCGDFNVVPAPIDSWNEERLAGTIFHTEAERDRIQALQAAGFADLFRHKYPDEQVFSWWDYRGGAFHRKQGLRIDFLLGSPELLGRVKEVSVGPRLPQEAGRSDAVGPCAGDRGLGLDRLAGAAED